MVPFSTSTPFETPSTITITHDSSTTSIVANNITVTAPLSTLLITVTPSVVVMSTTRQKHTEAILTY